MTRGGLKTPRSAAIAGIAFAALMTTSILLFRMSVGSGPLEAGKWLAQGDRRSSLVVAVNLIPFAGIAFLWFIGVVRDRLGEQEDRFLATVFLGSGLLFVAMLFASTAVAIGMLASFSAAPGKGAETQVWELGRHMTITLLNVFAARMAAVFMISTSTIGLRTAVINRWLAYLGLAIALVLLIASGSVPYVYLLFPFWILTVSIDVLINNLREGREPSAASQGS
jgi:hypothetical protein